QPAEPQRAPPGGHAELVTPVRYRLRPVEPLRDTPSQYMPAAGPARESARRTAVRVGRTEQNDPPRRRTVPVFQRPQHEEATKAVCDEIQPRCLERPAMPREPLHVGGEPQ